MAFQLARCITQLDLIFMIVACHNVQVANSPEHLLPESASEDGALQADFVHEREGMGATAGAKMGFIVRYDQDPVEERQHPIVQCINPLQQTRHLSKQLASQHMA